MSTGKDRTIHRDGEKSSKRGFLGRLRQFFIGHEKEIVFFVATILISVFSFEIGIMKGQGQTMGTLVIEKPVERSIALEQIEDNEMQSSSKVAGAQIDNTRRSENCIYVGSKNSDKYHSPTCHWADRIKPTNKVCFSSKDDAERRGYMEGCLE